jgi:Tfp pilus assembly protein PilX
MARRRSTRSCSRARTSERGFALAVALIVAVLYFGLIELMLFDASRELGEARRFRARVLAFAIAENAAERAALNIVEPTNVWAKANISDAQGSGTGEMKKTGTSFVITASGDVTGIVPQHATVDVYGRIVGTEVKIDSTTHSQ